MASVIALIASLVVISGVIAYVGDVLGTYIGKKRLSLFGTRPKRTGQIIGIGAGVAITLVTLGVSYLVFRGAYQVIFDAQRTYQQLAELKAQESSLTDQVESLNQQVSSTKDELTKAEETIQTAQEEATKANQERDEALADVQNLEQQRTELEKTSSELQTNLTALKTQFDTATKDLAKAKDDLANVEDNLASANEQREGALKEAEEAKIAAEAATKQVEELQAQIDTVQQELDSKNTELATQTQALEKAQTELETAQTTLEQAQSALETAQQERETAVRERDAAAAQIASLEENRNNLRDALSELNRDIGNLQTKANELTNQNADLTTENQQLLADSATLKEANTNLQTQNENLTSENDTLNSQAEQLEGQVAELNRSLQEQATQLNSINEMIRATNSGDLTYNINAVVHNGVITSQDPVQIRSDMTQLVTAANDKTARRGAGPIEMTTDQFESLVEAISESPGADIVTLRSRYNQFGEAPVLVNVEASINQKLLSRGQLVVSQQIHLGTELLPATTDEISTKVRELLRDANNKLLSKGLADDVYDVSTASDGSSLSPEAFSNLLSRLTGPVTIGLVASEEVYSIGPVKLSLVIIN